ncbi:hypothetical protein HPB48_016580 [Haemaphysalis longicornis]|uniref:Uncharacterized protein n=1 Tax=Haemaphysalis longicornis TaxID=44386 RepID=A0A9J6GWJ3_HAELO|nr:hypothetical protein HPB48_016580 [Haemaphysalis longicornis]
MPKKAKAFSDAKAKEKLTPVLAGEEPTINSRQLTYALEEPGKVSVLTRSHLLTKKKQISLPKSRQTSVPSSTAADTKRRRKHRRSHANAIWNRW